MEEAVGGSAERRRGQLPHPSQGCCAACLNLCCLGGKPEGQVGGLGLEEATLGRACACWSLYTAAVHSVAAGLARYALLLGVLMGCTAWAN